MIIDVERQSISDEIWYQNYQGPEDKTIADTWERQAKACSDIENPDIKDKVYQDFKWLLEDFKGVAGGRITANLGIQGRNAVTMMNCFTYSPGDIDYKDPDSIEGIYDMLKAQAHTLKSEGGYGMNFSWIRPNGTYIEGIDSRTPGVLSFMELWDTSSKIVTQGSEKVIGAKRANEKKKIRKGAQMGVLECVSGDTLISTINGRFQIKDLIGKKPYIFCTNGNGDILVQQSNKVWKKGKRKTLKIKIDNNDCIVCTLDHELMLYNGKYIKAKDLKIGEALAGFEDKFGNIIRLTVVSVIKNGKQDVYDMSVPEFHNFVANGVFVHNCWHPEIEDFIDAKLVEGRLSKFNLSVGITDGFMDAVLNDKDWVLKFPDTTHPEFNNWDGDIYKWESKNLPVIVYKTIKAKFLWNKIVKSTYTRNDPGVLFLDLANKKNPLNYAERIATSNPCFHGDTLIAVADGRGTVSIKQLADEGKDVPVYSVDMKTGKVEIKLGRHPRITGTDQKLLRVHLDDGSYLDVTPNHKFITLSGIEKRADELVNGDSLPRFLKAKEPVKNGGKPYYRIYGNVIDQSKDKIFEHRLIAKYYHSDEWDTLYESLKSNGFAKTGGVVVHHKDYNQLNNSPENLQVMSFKEHSKMHGEIDQSGEKNGRFSGITHEQIKEAGVQLSKELGRQFSLTEWRELAESKGMPVTFSKFRQKELGTLFQFAKMCAIEAGVFLVDADPRAQETYKNMLSFGYTPKIINGKTYVVKKCEMCSSEFDVPSHVRERAICPSCIANNNIAFKRSCDYFDQKADNNKVQQAKVYSDLKFSLGKKPMRKEWENECKSLGVPFRLNSKRSFKSWDDVIQAGESYNHKVVRVQELEGLHTVYNITVDDYHTVGIVTVVDKTKNIICDGIFTLQCGEILMSLGTCLLFSLNLVKYIKKVQDHFEFDFETFKKAVSIAVRFSDNINDITKVPLPEYKKAMLEKRRMGVGVLSLGSLHYILGIRFGSEQSQKLIHDIFKTKAEAEILASARLGKEKGSFPLFDKEKYFNSYWWKTLPISDEVKAEVEEIGEMRNSHRSANAPTGNMSLYVGVVSGGIEPVFMKEYSRWSVVVESERIRLKELGFKFPDVASKQWFETENLKASKAGTDDILIGSFNGKTYQVDKNRGLTVKTDVVDYGWLFVQNNFTKEQIEKMTSDGVFCTTSDLSVQDHINTLKIISPFVDQNSSKTINVPGDYPFDDFEDVYLNAWKSGIKGLTTYRAGTMTAVLEEKKDIVTVDAMSPIKRPKELPCEIHRPKINGQEWGVIVGLYEDEPFEIFAGPLKLPDFPGKGIGSLIKKKRGVYSLRVGNTEIDNVIDYFADDKSAWATRMVSMCLRHRIPLKFISDQLSKDGYITDINNVLARILKKYAKVEGKMKCPSCGSERIVLEEGCMKCLECTYGKCG